MNYLDRYQSLREGYLQGIYTEREVVGQAFDMLVEGSNREMLWQALAPEHREEIYQYLQNYDEAAAPLLVHDHWQIVKEDTIALKRWLEMQRQHHANA
jgi:predicted protein tyrosine phosphatase